VLVTLRRAQRRAEVRRVEQLPETVAQDASQALA
jgi:hypothetical protein